MTFTAAPNPAIASRYGFFFTGMTGSLLSVLFSMHRHAGGTKGQNAAAPTAPNGARDRPYPRENPLTGGSLTSCPASLSQTARQRFTPAPVSASREIV